MYIFSFLIGLFIKIKNLNLNNCALIKVRSDSCIMFKAVHFAKKSKYK